ncbi:DUF6768 family protein [Brevundimonas sp. VNH65]|uniref:DUF6768 family protein n=1 Tax=Brevundimonas sp. VNH65 TaxID=3400917 RepID=UPI003C0BFAC0
MTSHDHDIDRALAAEERDLLRRIGEDPGHIQQTLALFSGRSAWVSIVLMIVQTAAFVAAVWTGWRFFQATEVLEALRWGLPSAVLLIVSLMIKLALWQPMQANRLLAAIRRLELLIAARRRD